MRAVDLDVRSKHIDSAWTLHVYNPNLFIYSVVSMKDASTRVTASEWSAQLGTVAYNSGPGEDKALARIEPEQCGVYQNTSWDSKPTCSSCNIPYQMHTDGAEGRELPGMRTTTMPISEKYDGAQFNEQVRLLGFPVAFINWIYCNFQSTQDWIDRMLAAPQKALPPFYSSAKIAFSVADDLGNTQEIDVSCSFQLDFGEMSPPSDYPSCWDSFMDVAKGCLKPKNLDCTNKVNVISLGAWWFVLVFTMFLPAIIYQSYKCCCQSERIHPADWLTQGGVHVQGQVVGPSHLQRGSAAAAGSSVMATPILGQPITATPQPPTGPTTYSAAINSSALEAGVAGSADLLAPTYPVSVVLPPDVSLGISFCDSDTGLVVDGMGTASPASAAGLCVGSIITSFNGHSCAKAKTEDMKVMLAQAPLTVDGARKVDLVAIFGRIIQIGEGQRLGLDLEQRPGGLFVRFVQPQSPAAAAGIQAGHLILYVHGAKAVGMSPSVAAIVVQGIPASSDGSKKVCVVLQGDKSLQQQNQHLGAI